MTFEELMKLDPIDVWGLYAYDDGTGTRCTGCTSCHNCTGCTRCTGCTDCTRCTGCWICTNCTNCTGCTSCRDCWGLKGGKNRQYVAFGEQLTADQWAQFLVKMKAPQPKRKNDDV